jgi:hypothetical protein
MLPPNFPLRITAGPTSTENGWIRTRETLPAGTVLSGGRAGALRPQDRVRRLPGLIAAEPGQHGPG